MNGPERETPPVLNHAGGDEPARSPRISTKSQYFIGLLSHLVVAGGFVAASYAISGNEGDVAGNFCCGYVFVLAAVFIPGEVLRSRYGWKGFMPGVFTGIALTLLVPPILILSKCGFRM